MDQHNISSFTLWREGEAMEISDRHSRYTIYSDKIEVDGVIFMKKGTRLELRTKEKTVELEVMNRKTISVTDILTVLEPVDKELDLIGIFRREFLKSPF